MKTTLYSFALVITCAVGLSTLNSCKKTVCDNTCSYAYDGVCDDGGSGSSYSICDCGTDCADCGERKKRVGPGVPGGGGCN
ncbi:MAG: hypothetical protein EP314_03435 [Bacteroidetes bacterium]|nr:MAG: hypothetical protein EP314_03435 [Bacteroidota bacterium]